MTKKREQAARQIIVVPLADLVLNPENVRRHSKRNIDAIVASLKRWGQQTPIVIDGKRVVHKGNGTVLAARELKWKTLECVPTTIKEAIELEAYGIADNRAGELSDFDEELLAQKLIRLSESDLLGATGFDDAEFEELNALLSDTAPGPVKRGLNGNKLVPVVRVVIAIARNLDRFEAAMTATGELNREKALLRICEAYVSAHEKTQRQLQQ